MRSLPRRLHVPLAGRRADCGVGVPLRDVILGFDAEHYVEGHHESVSSRTEMESLFEKMQQAETAVREGWAIPAPDEDTQYFVGSFSAGRALEQ
jgi:hypothetical protein